MNHLKKKIEVTLLEEAEEYFNGLSDKMQDKFLKTFDKTESGLKGTWFEKVTSKSGIIKFRERDQAKFYRFFAFWVNDTETKTLILCTHGLDKKTNNPPKSDIERTLRIKEQYFNDKNNKK